MDIDLVFSPKQAEFFRAAEPIVGYIGGIGSGKTHVGARWAWFVCQQHPGILGLIAANTYKQLSQSTLRPLFKFLLDNHLPFEWNRAPSWFTSTLPSHEGVLSFPNGSQIITRSLERYDDLRGAEYGFAWCDETRETSRDAWLVLKGRMRGRGPQQVKITSSPNGFDWMWEILVEQPRKDPTLASSRRLVQASIYDNRANLTAEYIRGLETDYAEDYAKQELLGLFVPMGVGVVYSAFQVGQNVIEPLDDARQKAVRYEPDRTLLVAADFNVSPMCWIVAQERPVDGTRSLVVIDEIVRKHTDAGRTPTESIAAEFVSRYDRHFGPVILYGDYYGHSARSSASESDWKQVLRVLRSRLPIVELRVEHKGDGADDVRGGNPLVVDRVNTVNTWLRSFDGTTRCYISSRCHGLIRDLQQVRWKERAGVREIDKSDLSLTHLSDCLGYLVMGRHLRRPTLAVGHRSAAADPALDGLLLRSPA